nr:hypothetical protein [Tanacetum cinerariifolium]
MKRASKGYTRVDIPLFPAMIVQSLIFHGEGSTVPVVSHHTSTYAPSTSPPRLSSPPRSSIRQETKVPQPNSPTRTHVLDKAASIGVDVRHGGDATTVASLDAGHCSGNIDKTPFMPYDSPLLRVNTLKSDEGNMSLQELMVLCTILSQKFKSLEADLKQTKQVYGATYTKLIVKVSTQGEAHSQEDQPKNQLGVLSAAKVLADTARRNVQTYTRRRAVSTGSGRVSTASRIISTAKESVSTGGASMPVSTAGIINKEERDKYSEVDQAKMLIDLINQRKRYFAAKRAKERRNNPMT